MNKTPKLRFKEFSGDWESKKLGNEFSLSSGSTPSKSKKEYFNGENYWVTSGELKKKYIDSTIEKISDVAIKESNLKKYPPGTFVIAIYGLEASGTRGSCGILKSHSTISQACMAFMSKGNISNEFLYYWYIKYGEKIGIKYAQGTKQQNLNGDLVGNFKITSPSKQEQEKIASFFSLIDDKISLQSEKVKMLKDYKKGMIQKIFSRELRFKDDCGMDYLEWEVKRFRDFVKINQGLQIPISERYNSEGENRYFYITNEFLKATSDTKYYIENPPKSVICEEDDILMTRTGNTGKVVTGVSGAFHNNFFKIDYDRRKYNKMFLYYILTSHKIQKNIVRLAGTSTIPDLNHGDFYNIKISLPLKKEQDKIATLLINLDAKIDKEQKKLDYLNEYKKGLLQKMFT